MAAMIVEPIQGEGGDNQASPEFFRGLQQIGDQVINWFLFLCDDRRTPASLFVVVIISFTAYNSHYQEN